MSSRQEEKEQRKQERLAREAAAAAAAKRKRLLQMIGGVVVACAILAGGAFALAGGGDDGASANDAELTAVAKKAGCEYRSFPNYGQDHIDKNFTAADYKTNPATSGNHVPTGKEAQAGLYIAGNEPNVGAWVHTSMGGSCFSTARAANRTSSPTSRSSSTRTSRAAAARTTAC
jgi:hypothetical protein